MEKREMDLDELLELCGHFTFLGSAVQQQLVSVLEGEPVADQNASAMRMVCKFLHNAASLGVNGAAELENHIKSELSKTSIE